MIQQQRSLGTSDSILNLVTLNTRVCLTLSSSAILRRVNCFISPKNQGPRPGILVLDSLHLRHTPRPVTNTEATHHSRTLPKVPSALPPGAYSQPCDEHNLTNRTTKCQPGGESTRRLYGASLSTARERASIKNPFENFTYVLLLFFQRYRLY